MTERAEITTAIQCRGCGQTGTALWREGPDSGSLKRMLIGVSPGFFPMNNPTPFGATAIVCDRCQQIHKA